MTTYLYIAQLAIPAALEPEFDRIYDEGYIPALLRIPGVVSATRYKLEWSDVPDMPEYLATYEVTDPMIPKSDAWKQASVDCGWAEHIRPHFIVRRHGMYSQAGAKAG